jgi:transglutaminase-like putative cysteine protease
LLREHEELLIEAHAVVEMNPISALPPKLDAKAWEGYNGIVLNDDHYDMIEPSHFADSSAELLNFMRAADLTTPEGDPLTALRTLQDKIYNFFKHENVVTDVTPIESALQRGRGGSQDFTHMMIAVGRKWGIPCRYVSGYLFPREKHDRSAADATHNWMEAYLPSLGWVGFDPAHNLIANERHIRAAVGRDYADVPATRGTYKGGADSELSVAVSLEPTQAPMRHEDFLKVARPMSSRTLSPSNRTLT